MLISIPVCITDTVYVAHIFMCWFRHSAITVHVEHTLTNVVCCGALQARVQICSAIKWTPRALAMEIVVTIVWTSPTWSAMISEFLLVYSMVLQTAAFYIGRGLKHGRCFVWLYSYFELVMYCHWFINQLINHMINMFHHKKTGNHSL